MYQNMTTKKKQLACTRAKEQFYDFSFLLFSTHNIFMKYVFFSPLIFLLFLYCINTLSKEKSAQYFFLFAVQLLNTQKITVEKMHRRLACSTSKIQMHTVLFCFRME